MNCCKCKIKLSVDPAKPPAVSAEINIMGIHHFLCYECTGLFAIWKNQPIDEPVTVTTVALSGNPVCGKCGQRPAAPGCTRCDVCRGGA